MEFSEGVNYTILVNNANKAFFENFESYKVLDTMDGFDAIKMQVEVFLSKRIVFNEIWYYLSKEEKSELLEILKRRNVSFVNITSNVEDVIYSDYVIVYDDDKKILEGNKEMVLRNEKLLKRLGYGIPFVVDLSIQLNYYDIFDTVYYDMELKLNGNIIGVVSNDFKEDNVTGKVRDIVVKKSSDALKMVGLDDTYLDKDISELSLRDKNKIILASKLQDKEIMLINFSRGLTNKDIEFFKKLFKKIINYGRKIVLVDRNSNMFINCVDKIYVINNKKIVLEVNDIYDKGLEKYIEVPKIVEFTNKTLDYGVNINHYNELDDLLKAIYRIKS